MHEIKISDASANTDMRFPLSRNVFVVANLESIEIDSHINTDISKIQMIPFTFALSNQK